MSNQYSIFDDCFVDSFAGGGGASTGIEKNKMKIMYDLHSIMTS